MTMIVAFHSLLFYTGKWWHFGGVVIPLWEKSSRFLDSLDLSMFVFISGFLFAWLLIFKGKYREKIPFLMGKAKRLLIPYLFWGVFLVLMQSSIHSWDLLLTGISHLWFLLMLFWIFCLTLLLQKLFLKSISYIKIGIILVFAYLVWFLFNRLSDHHFFLCIESALSYLPSFLLGCFCASKNIWHFSEIKAKLILFVSLLVLAIYVFFYPQLSYFLNDLLIRFLSYSAIVCMFTIMSRVNLSDKLLNKINRLDRLSMGVYIFNQIVINYILLIPYAKEWLIIHYLIGPLVIFIVSLFIPLLLSLTFNRYKWLSWSIGG